MDWTAKLCLQTPPQLRQYMVRALERALTDLMRFHA